MRPMGTWSWALRAGQGWTPLVSVLLFPDTLRFFALSRDFPLLLMFTPQSYFCSADGWNSGLLQQESACCNLHKLWEKPFQNHLGDWCLPCTFKGDAGTLELKAGEQPLLSTKGHGKDDVFKQHLYRGGGGTSLKVREITLGRLGISEGGPRSSGRAGSV